MSNHENEELISLFLANEIRETVFQIPATKSSRPNGFRTGYFQDHWEVVKVPRRMTELRPISLSNVVYKIIAKIHDNILVVHEIWHSLKQGVDREDGRITVKLDMAKDYDRVE
ncbi:hypothetical protein ACFX2K_017065 [Malus domestica]